VSLHPSFRLPRGWFGAAFCSLVQRMTTLQHARDRILGLRIISAHYAVIKHPLRRMPERAGLCLRRARMRRSRVSPVLFA
jgi:hypothetical protein